MKITYEVNGIRFDDKEKAEEFEQKLKQEEEDKKADVQALSLVIEEYNKTVREERAKVKEVKAKLSEAISAYIEKHGTASNIETKRGYLCVRHDWQDNTALYSTVSSKVLK